jgi:hypothetical protein
MYSGYQSGVVGNAWTMQYALSTISWFAPRARDTSCDPYLTLALNYDASAVKVASPDVCCRLSFLLPAQPFIINLYRTFTSGAKQFKGLHALL